MRIETVLILFGLLWAGSALAATPDFYVTADGNDAWAGKQAKPNAKKTDGPFATVQRAQQAVRDLRKREPKRNVPIRVAISGVHYMEKPLLLTPEDSGAAKSPTIFYGVGKVRPVLSGGVPLTHWQKDTKGGWHMPLSDVRKNRWNFAQLWVNGERRYRPRLPKNGYFRVARALPPSPAAQEKGFDQFQFKSDGLRANWQNRGDIEALCFQIWTMARLRVAQVDDATHTVRFTGHTPGTADYFGLKTGNRYIMENVKEALTEPGEWYLDRPTGELTYLPKPGEDPKTAVVIAPRLDHLVEFKGDAAAHQWVHDIRFENLTFAHTNYNTPQEGHNCGQAEADLAGAIRAEGAWNCAFQNCTILHTGEWGVAWGAGCRDNRLENCELTDLGAGGVKIGETQMHDDEQQVAAHNQVKDCLIAHGGRLHPAGIGVWIGHSPHNTIWYNDIYDFYYTGVSVGWSWGYGKSQAHGNAIEYNRIAWIGQGVLSDMGGIYTLGVSPNTLLFHNLITHVESFDYGGWGIYPDEGSTGLTITNNIVAHTKTGGFHQHYGRENLVRNNIFAFSREGQIIRTRAEDHLSFTFEHNIVYFNEGSLLGSNWSGNNYRLDHNLYWNAGKGGVTFADYTPENWKEKGQDVHSKIADPLFVNPEADDFRLKPNSPALNMGMYDLRQNDPGRLPGTPRKPLTEPANRAFPPPPEPISEDFETTPAGEKAADAVTNEENDKAIIRVTDETAANGKHSLKFTDAAGQKFSYSPHLYYQPHFDTGQIEGSFALRIEPGAVFYHEWRDSASPYHIGPSLVIGADGVLKANGKPLQTLPFGKWVRITVTCGMGTEATGKYELTVMPPGRTPPLHYHDIACDPLFRSLRWYGFVSNTEGPSVFYVDAIHLQLVAKK